MGALIRESGVVRPEAMGREGPESIGVASVTYVEESAGSSGVAGVCLQCLWGGKGKPAGSKAKLSEQPAGVPVKI